MDLVTQGLLGAVVGQVGFQRRLGKRAILWGGVVGLLPDADILAVKFSSNPMAMELIHRGITHSVFFALMMAVPLGFLLRKIDNHLYAGTETPPKAEQIKIWSILCFWSLITHPLLDLFTTFGTQLLAPFSNHRFALSAIPIIDPVYSVPLLVSILAGVFWSSKSFIVSSITLFLTSTYLLFGIMQRDLAMDVARSFCTDNDLKCHRIEAFPLLPTLFAQRLWVQTKDKIYITEYSGWTKKNKPWISDDVGVIPTKVREHELFKVYEWFTNGIYVTKANTNYGFCVIDSRFGLLSHQPLGRFSLCFDKNSVVKNADYDAIESDKNSVRAGKPEAMLIAANVSKQTSFGSKLGYYTQLISNLCAWTFD
eukprot:gene24918-32473_t